MQTIKTLSTLIILCLFSTQLIANEAELSLNDDSVKIASQFDVSGFDVEASFIHNQDRGNIFGVAGLIYGDAGAPGLNAGLGLKLAYVDPNVSGVSGELGLPIGGKVTYVPEDYNRFNARGYLWYAPSVLSLGELERYQEIGGDVGYNITRNADVFLGYRNVKVKYDNFGTGTIDTGFHLGIRGRF